MSMAAASVFRSGRGTRSQACFLCRPMVSKRLYYKFFAPDCQPRRPGAEGACGGRKSVLLYFLLSYYHTMLLQLWTKENTPDARLSARQSGVCLCSSIAGIRTTGGRRDHARSVFKNAAPVRKGGHGAAARGAGGGLRRSSAWAAAPWRRWRAAAWGRWT